MMPTCKPQTCKLALALALLSAYGFCLSFFFPTVPLRLIKSSGSSNGTWPRLLLVLGRQLGQHLKQGRISSHHSIALLLDVDGLPRFFQKCWGFQISATKKNTSKYLAWTTWYMPEPCWHCVSLLQSWICDTKNNGNNLEQTNGANKIPINDMVFICFLVFIWFLWDFFFLLQQKTQAIHVPPPVPARRCPTRTGRPRPGLRAPGLCHNPPWHTWRV